MLIAHCSHSIQSESKSEAKISSQTGTFSIGLPSVISPNISNNVEDLHNRHKKVFEAEYSESGSGSSSPTEWDHSKPPLAVEQRSLNLLEAEKLLSSFRLKASLFPFVQIASNATVPTLARDSPFLLLALLTSASIKDPPLYHQLDHEFRRILSLKIIVEGRKSMDFLQGLLVYIAW